MSASRSRTTASLKIGFTRSTRNCEPSQRHPLTAPTRFRVRTLSDSIQWWAIKTVIQARWITSSQTRITCPSDTPAATGMANTQGGVYGNPADGLQDAFGSRQSKTHINTTAIQYNHIFSPTFLNELVASSHRSSHQQGTRADDTNWPNELGFPNPFGATGWPTFYTD